jgi:hypothetical protein
MLDIALGTNIWPRWYRSAKKTHLPRRIGAQNAETYGSSLAQISQAGRWNSSVLVKAYLTHLPRQFIRIVAGFSANAGDYFLPRADTVDVPILLQQQIWPWLEEWEARFEARAKKKRWAEGGLDSDDLAADGFVKLLRHLRLVLLQDLAILQPRFPSLPFFSHPPFYGPLWDRYAVAVQANTTVGEPRNLLLHQALPEINGVLESSRDAILHSVSGLKTEVKTDISAVQSALDALTSALTGGRLRLKLTGDLSGYFEPLGQPIGQSGGQAGGQPPTLAALPAQLAQPAQRDIPIWTSLPKAYTVRDAWKQWQTTFCPLEEQFDSAWRPGNTIRVQFCRRKVLWDEIKARIARGKAEDEVIADLERQRGQRKLQQLCDDLRRRRQGRGQGGTPPAEH